PPAMTRAATQTVVTLGFDDGWKDQFTAGRPILRSHGMNGTFYINSGLVNADGHVKLADISVLASDGDEIGGHTVDNAALTRLSADAARQEVCGDRNNLLNWGFTVRNFAYPYGAVNASAEHVVYDCGYDSARTVGGLNCNGCSYAETIPPAVMYDTRT